MDVAVPRSAFARSGSWIVALLLSSVILTACQVRPTLTPTSDTIPANPTVQPTVVLSASVKATAAVPVSSAATAVGLTATVAATSTLGPRNLALKGTVAVSAGSESASRAIDGDPETLWSAGAGPPQSFQVTLDKVYQVSRIELLVAQTPAGQTTHEIWLGDTNGKLQLYRKLSNTWTADGQTIVVDVQPPQLTDRVMIRTTDGPSYVAWREVRVIGQEPTAATIAQSAAAVTPSAEIDWPKIRILGDFDKPDKITNAADGSGRLFVSEQAGRIRIDRNGTLLTTPFLDISDRVKCCEGEQGFFGVAFPPNFTKSKHFYVTGRAG